MSPLTIGKAQLGIHSAEFVLTQMQGGHFVSGLFAYFT